MSADRNPLVEAAGLVKSFTPRAGLVGSRRPDVRAVDGVSFNVSKGETFGLVGESGCGKSVSALSVMRLIKNPPGKIVDGRISFEGSDLLKLSEAKMRSIRGARISMIFQQPQSSLNPVFRVGDQLTEVRAADLRFTAGEIEALIGVFAKLF